MLMDMKITIKIKGLEKAIKEGGSIQQFITNQIAEGVKPYVPKKTGNLESTVVIKESEIIWSTPYAKSVWYGKTKNGQDMQFNTALNPRAGRLWGERYKSDKLNEIKAALIKEVERVK